MKPDQIDTLLEDACRELGFCLSPDAIERIRVLPEMTAARLATEVVKEELGSADARWVGVLSDRFAVILDQRRSDWTSN